MQEHNIYLAKIRSERKKPVADSLYGKATPQPSRGSEPIKKRSWMSWVQRLLSTLMQTQDLDLEKFQQLETKRTRHQIEQNRISRYF